MNGTARCLWVIPAAWVYLSANYGVSFTRLGQQLPLSTYSLSQVSVAFFDARYANNHAVYAISDAQGNQWKQ